MVVKLGGLQHRKYLIKLSEAPCSKESECAQTYEAAGVAFERRSVRKWVQKERKLLPVLSECYKLMFDQDTNLLHSITYLYVLKPPSDYTQAISHSFRFDISGI